ncbi:hypothetical protein CcaverHIS002_0301420 [Cutaneotrichosporon cavernicola]|nr:hypothetical protein CcaverHIS002_0301420 [Cutaneotrichosporon cavernicola]BEI97842.1 hypothetical protein CcaverHIS631_0301410 [Cutaneotrichosporon cavernicola]
MHPLSMIGEPEAMAVEALLSLRHARTPAPPQPVYHEGEATAAQSLLDLHYTGAPSHHSQPPSHTRGTASSEMTENHHYLDNRHMPAVANVPFPISDMLYIGPRPVYTPPQAAIHQAAIHQAAIHQAAIHQSPPSNNIRNLPEPIPAHRPIVPAISSPPRPAQFYSEPVRGGPSKHRSAYQPSAHPFGPSMVKRTPRSPHIRLPPIQGILKNTNSGPLSPLRRVSGSSPTVPKELFWYPPGGSENSLPLNVPSTRIISPRFPNSPARQAVPGAVSIRAVSGPARSSPPLPTFSNPTVANNTTSPTGPTFQSFGPPVTFAPPAPISDGKRKTVLQTKSKAPATRAKSASSNTWPSRGNLKRIGSAVLNRVSNVNILKRQRIEESKSCPAPPQLPEPKWKHDNQEQEELDQSTEEDVGELDSDEDDTFSPEGDEEEEDEPREDKGPGSPPMSAKRKHQIHLAKRRQQENDAHKQIAEAKLANFKAGKLYAYAKENPLYNPDTNIDEWLIKHWSVWGTKELSHQLEGELYRQFTDEEKRMVCTRRKKDGDPHRDLPKAVRVIYLAKYTDVANIFRPKDQACHRCVTGGYQCTQTRLPKKVRKSQNPRLPTCAACECSKGVCYIALEEGATREPKFHLDFQVWLERLDNPSAWPNFPPIDLAELDPPFPFDPVLRVYNKRTKNNSEPRSSIKREAEDDDEFEAEQPVAKRVLLEPEVNAESSAMGARRRRTSKQPLAQMVSLEPEVKVESSAMGALRRAASKLRVAGAKASIKKSTPSTAAKATQVKKKMSAKAKSKQKA